LVFAAAAIAAIVASAGAKAAAPAYCALYAREYAVDTVQPAAAAGMLQSVQDQAYYRCLNQDEDPPLPKASAYFGTGIANTLATATPDPSAVINKSATPPLPRQSPAAPAVAASVTAPVAPAPTAKPAAPVIQARASAATQAPYRGSGLTAWTQEWMDWCSQNFPNSWDAKSGTILHYGSDSRELCR
jgi:hypothetical protein